MPLRRTIACLVLAAYAATCAGQGLPDLGDASEATLSQNAERTIGNRIMREIRGDKDFIDDPEITDYINGVGNRLNGAATGPKQPIDFFVVQDDAVNAFALVGGHIGVHTGLILITTNESELAGVVGHEVAHILQRHQARMMQAQGPAQLLSLAALALALLAARGSSSQSGQVTSAALATATAASYQSQINYTRENEREADRIGITLMEGAGYDPRGMVGMFERMLRANRLNELGGAPSYLRTHPLTTERIADMQGRVDSLPARMIPDSIEYRLVRARLRAKAGSANDAVTYFRNALADKTVLRPREDVYGLAIALRRSRDFAAADKELATIRPAGGTMPGKELPTIRPAGGTAADKELPTFRAAGGATADKELPTFRIAGSAPHPWIEVLAARNKQDLKQPKEALDILRAALKSWPQDRSVFYAYVELSMLNGDRDAAIAALRERTKTIKDDSYTYELLSKALESAGRSVAQHRAQAEAYYYKGNLAAAADQLELALKIRGGDFYELSGAEARLREIRVQLETERAAEKALKIE
jgi:beta-barrel assembly-enhancing protease